MVIKHDVSNPACRTSDRLGGFRTDWGCPCGACGGVLRTGLAQERSVLDGNKFYVCTIEA